MPPQPYQKLVIKAYAKVNLALEVLGRRPDGYHEIASILQTIDLYDTLSFEPASELKLDCPPELASETNLVMRAARQLKQVSAYRQGAHITLEKGIPVAGGLGGGSSDAAAALHGLNRLWGLGLARERLAAIAAGLGSDVSFFVYGGTALARGRGERISPLPPLAEHWLVLLHPNLPIPEGKTARLYSRLNPTHFSEGEATVRLFASLSSELDISLLYNVFEKVAFDFFPGLSDYRQRFLEAGAPSVHLAGSGPTLFTMLKQKEPAAEICRRLEAQGLEAYLAGTVSQRG